MNDHKLGYKIRHKIYFVYSHLDFFPSNLDDVNNKQEISTTYFCHWKTLLAQLEQWHAGWLPLVRDIRK